MKNKIVTHFYVKEARKDSKGVAPIYLRITVNGERSEISTNKKVDPELWDKSSERVSGRSEPARIINVALNNLMGKVEKYNKSDMRLSDLNNLFIEEYNGYLKSSKGLKQNSAAKDIKNLYRVINKAVSYRWITKNPFKDFSCNYVNPPRAYLTDEEIESLYRKEFAIKRLARVRDVFIFQIYTGLSYIDLAELTEDNIEIGINGNRWIVIHRKKTGTRSSIPILPRAQEILDRYKNDPHCVSESRLLPVCTNQRMNGYLKEIADLCGIKKPLTTHLARHTFATTITLSNGVPIETVSKMLGHSDLKTTQIYSKVVDRKIADDMKNLLKVDKNSELGVAK